MRAVVTDGSRGKGNSHDSVFLLHVTQCLFYRFAWKFRCDACYGGSYGLPVIAQLPTGIIYWLRRCMESYRRSATSRMQFFSNGVGTRRIISPVDVTRFCWARENSYGNFIGLGIDNRDRKCIVSRYVNRWNFIVGAGTFEATLAWKFFLSMLEQVNEYREWKLQTKHGQTIRSLCISYFYFNVSKRNVLSNLISITNLEEISPLTYFHLTKKLPTRSRPSNYLPSIGYTLTYFPQKCLEPVPQFSTRFPILYAAR